MNTSLLQFACATSFKRQIVGQQYEITHTVGISKRLHSIIKTNRKKKTCQKTFTLTERSFYKERANRQITNGNKKGTSRDKGKNRTP